MPKDGDDEEGEGEEGEEGGGEGADINKFTISDKSEALRKSRDDDLYQFFK